MFFASGNAELAVMFGGLHNGTLSGLRFNAMYPMERWFHLLRLRNGV